MIKAKKNNTPEKQKSSGWIARNKDIIEISMLILANCISALAAFFAYRGINIAYEAISIANKTNEIAISSMLSEEKMRIIERAPALFFKTSAEDQSFSIGNSGQGPAIISDAHVSFRGINLRIFDNEPQEEKKSAYIKFLKEISTALNRKEFDFSAHIPTGIVPSQAEITILKLKNKDSDLYNAIIREIKIRICYEDITGRLKSGNSYSVYDAPECIFTNPLIKID